MHRGCFIPNYTSFEQNMRKVNESTYPYEIEPEIKHGNFTRTAFLAKELGLPVKNIVR